MATSTFPNLLCSLSTFLLSPFIFFLLLGRLSAIHEYFNLWYILWRNSSVLVRIYMENKVRLAGSCTYLLRLHIIDGLSLFGTISHTIIAKYIFPQKCCLRIVFISIFITFTLNIHLKAFARKIATNY